MSGMKASILDTKATNSAPLLRRIWLVVGPHGEESAEDTLPENRAPIRHPPAAEIPRKESSACV